MYQPFGGYPITCGWDCHRSRGSLGGVDRAMGMGTPLPACHEGTVYYIPYNGTGGHTATIYHPDGTKTQYMHLSSFALSNGTYVSEGQVVGYSGGCAGCDGAGSSTGPHLHAHGITAGGTRVPPFYEGMGGGSGGSGTYNSYFNTILTVDQRRDLQRRLGVEDDGDFGPLSIAALQEFLGVEPDGVFGPASTAALQRYIGADPDGIWGAQTTNVFLACLAYTSTFRRVIPIGARQRQVHPDSPVIRRTGPATSYDSIEPDFAAGTVLDVDGWITGQKVSGIDVWFKVGSTYSWAGGFTSASTANLPDLNPKEPTDVTRTVASVEARRRKSPSTSGENVDPSWQPGEVVTVKAFVKGQEVSLDGVTTNIWFLNHDDTYSWAGGFTDTSTTGLAEVPAPVEPDPQYPTTKYAFTKDLDVVTRVAAADWSNFENEYSVPKVSDRKGFPAKPKKVIVHQWGAPGAYTLGSVVNTMQARHTSGNEMGVHFVVDGNEIVQGVKLGTRAYHAGSKGNDYVGIEADPLMTESVIKNVRKVLEGLREFYGTKLEIELHRNVANTSCGQYIEPHLEALDIDKPYPPNQAPELEPVVLAAENIKAQAAAISAQAQEIVDYLT